MLHVIILILKIIGITLLSILGILLLLLVSVLLVPIRYRMDARILEERRVQVKITWLLHCFSVPIVYDKEGLKLCLKVFGLPIKKVPIEEAQDPKPQERASDSKEKTTDTALTVHQDSQLTGDVPEREYDSTEDFIPSPEKKEKKKFFPLRILSDILEKLKKLKYTIRTFCAKIKKSVGKVQDLKAFFFLDCTQEALRLGLGQLFYLLKKLGPRHIRGWIHFGMEDPALTGQILGGLSAVYGAFPKKLELRPDFQRAVLEGELQIRGHFHLITMAGIAWKLWRDKNVKAVYQKVKAGI